MHREKIQKQLDLDKYQSISEFLNTAIENQLFLEETSVPTAFNAHEITPYPDFKIKEKPSVINKYRIKEMETFYSVIPSPNYSNLVLSNQNLPEIQTWIWGQINKVFPVKVGLRILQKMLGDKQTIELNDYLTVASQDAAAIGKIIRDYEETHAKSRSEKISAGFPHVNDEKSQTRYKFQFLAYQRKDDLLDGAMSLLRFCNLERKSNKVYIGLTDAGAMFSQKSNPVLDDSNLDIPFSESEINFYLTHIKKNVLSEYSAIKWLLNTINDGNNDREKINVELDKKFGEKWNATTTVINTQRSGITARAFELGLIQKTKNGIYVTYNVTDTGKYFLNNS